MKIIFSPTKSQNTKDLSTKETQMVFPEQTRILVDHIQKLNLSQIKNIFKVSEALAEKTFAQYESFYYQKAFPALDLFSGISFKQLQKDSYTDSMQKYAQQHIVIFSALYGVVEPGNFLFPYRLDMHDSIGTQDLGYKNLYTFWSAYIHDYFKDEDMIINLASREYALMIPEALSDKIVHVDFFTDESCTKKVSSVEAKKQRGKLLDYCIRNQIMTREALVSYTEHEYQYSLEKSDARNCFFYKK